MFKFLKNDKKEKIDYERLNEIINIVNIILKIVFVLVIILILYVGTKVLSEWGIFTFIKTILAVLSPLFIGVVVAWLLNPIVKGLSKKGVNRILGTILTYLVFLVIIYLIIYSLIPVLSHEINVFVKNVPSYLDSLSGYTDNFFEKLNSPNYDITNIKIDFYNKVETLVSDFTTRLPEVTIKLFKGFVGAIWSFILGMIIALYLLFDFDNANKKLKSLIPNRYKNVIHELCSKIDISLKNFIHGTLIVSSIIFIVCAIGFWLAGLKAPILFALFAALTNIIPYIGPYIGAAPAVLVGYAQGPVVGTIVLIVSVVIQLIEGNFIQPLVMSKTMKLHPVTIIVGLLIFGYFFGIVGMIISTPIISVMKIIVKFINEKFHILDIKI